MKNGIKKIDLSQDMYGIHMELVTRLEKGNEPRNYLEFKFNVKRKGILKRWELIESQLPDMGIIQVENNPVRFVDRIPIKKLIERKEHGRYKFICEARPSEAKNSGYIREGKLRLRNSQTGEFSIGEMLRLTVSIPFMFSMNIAEELDRVMELRKMIFALNSVIVANERVKAIKGETLLQEFEPQVLSNLVNKGNYWGNDEVTEGTPF